MNNRTNTRQRAEQTPACMMNGCDRPAEPERREPSRRDPRRVIPASETKICSRCSQEAASYEGAALDYPFPAQHMLWGLR